MTDNLSPAEVLSAQKGPRITAAKIKPSAVWRCCLREHRMRLRLTLQDVAEVVGISVTGLCQIESGSNLKLTTAAKLADFYGVAIETIWKERT